MRNKVRKLRMENGLTQTELGQIVSVSRQTICAVELGHCDPSIWLAFDIAQLFDMRIAYHRRILFTDFFSQSRTSNHTLT